MATADPTSLEHRTATTRMPHLSRNETKLIIELLRAECRSHASGKPQEVKLLRRLETRMAQSAFTHGQVRTTRGKPILASRSEKER